MLAKWKSWKAPIICVGIYLSMLLLSEPLFFLLLGILIFLYVNKKGGWEKVKTGLRRIGNVITLNDDQWRQLKQILVSNSVPQGEQQTPRPQQPLSQRPRQNEGEAVNGSARKMEQNDPPHKTADKSTLNNPANTSPALSKVSAPKNQMSEIEANQAANLWLNEHSQEIEKVINRYTIEKQVWTCFLSDELEMPPIACWDIIRKYCEDELGVTADFSSGKFEVSWFPLEERGNESD